MTRSSVRAAVLGHPVGHSLSPVLHAAAYEALGLTAHYTRRDVPVGEWDTFWADARAAGDWGGFSVTMPLKPLAARDADRVTPLVRALGVANTLTFEDDGRVVADNTDVMGIMSAVSAAVAALHGLGAETVDVVVRTPSRARTLDAVARAVGTEVRTVAWEYAAEALHTADVVVATLPPRGADELALQWRAQAPSVSGVLLDAAYDPWPSRLASAWQDAGGAIAPGVDMLIFQAVDQVRWFTQGDPLAAIPHEDRVTAAMCRAVGRPERGIPQRVRIAQATRLAP